MNFIHPDIEHYALQHTEPEPEILAQLNRETWLKVLQPRMLSGHLQGRFLSLLSKLIQPKRILEIGTYTGYSALCLAEGLQQDGHLHTIDVNEELETFAKRYFAMSGRQNQITMHIGDARQIIPQLNEQWDVVFIDADKENYTAYFDLVIDHVVSGGVLIADNVLWSGKVLNPPTVNDGETAALQQFNSKVLVDSRVEAQLLPIRDGLMILQKK